MSNDLATYTNVRIDDTVEWRLVIFISEIGMSAYLKNIENPIENIVTLFEEMWEKNESSLLNNVENAIFAHPQILDDFSTEILICSPKVIWSPNQDELHEDAVIDEYLSIYCGEASDVLTTLENDLNCTYSLTPGLLPFLRRTIPGARIRCHQNVLVSKFLSTHAECPVLYVDIREGAADYVLIDKDKLLLASTHMWKDVMDIGYMIINIFDVYELNLDNVQVSISGSIEDKQSLIMVLRQQIAYVTVTKLPTAVSKLKLPLSVALSLSRPHCHNFG